MDSLIAIPSRSRYRPVGDSKVSVLQRGTLSAIPSELIPYTKLFVPRDQLSEYKKSVFNYLSGAYDQLEVVPTDAPNLALKRPEMARWAQDKGFEKIIMIDDDIVSWSTRIDPHGTSLRKSTADDMSQMFATVDLYLNWYVGIGVSARFRNDAYVGDFPVVRENTRIMRFNSYRIKEFLECEHGRVVTSEDMDISLQLLLRGFKTATLYNWTHDQKATGTPGGCADYRTLEMHNSDKELLHSIYPDFTRLVHKKNYGEEAIKAGMAERIEVVIKWEEAYRHGLMNRTGDSPYL